MLIIFGIRRRRKQLGVVLLLCQRCQRPCAHAVVRLQTWFALFFIPVAPLGTRYLTVCSLCAGSTRIDKEQAERLEQAAAQQAGQVVQMTPDGPLSPLGWPAAPGAPMPGAPPVSPPYPATVLPPPPPPPPA
jgi:hypothetical protein